MKQTYQDGTEITCQININIRNLKIFAILMCKGSLNTKAEYLFDLILGPENARAEEAARLKDEHHCSYISWKSGRMTSILR